jgi:guanyl-specific ribonuclease Sa
MPVAVSDARSNANDQIAHAADALRKSPRRKKVFAAIYWGKKKAKTVAEIMKVTKLTRVAVLQDGGKLAGLHIVDQIKIGGKTAYQKDPFIATNKTKILSLANSPEKLKEYPTKYNRPGAARSGPLRVIVQGANVRIAQVTCDDFDQFSKIKDVKIALTRTISEKAMKAGVCKLIGEKGEFADWGGEKNDLYTIKLKFKGKRRPAAFAFKGPGMQGTLTPKKLGKNGDQI